LAGDTLANEPELPASLLEQPQVTAVAPFLSGQALIARRASSTLGITARQGFTQMLGIDPELQARVLDLDVLRVQSGAIAESGGIVLGASLAQQLGVMVGDKVMIREISGATATLTVVGTFRVGNELIDAV